jgi:hypothetical protein
MMGMRKKAKLLAKYNDINKPWPCSGGNPGQDMWACDDCPINPKPGGTCVFETAQERAVAWLKVHPKKEKENKDWCTECEYSLVAMDKNPCVWCCRFDRDDYFQPKEAYYGKTQGN